MVRATRSERIGLGAIAALGLALASRDARADPGATTNVPRVHYRVTIEGRGLERRWRVELRASGLDPSRRQLRLELPGWGEWYDLDECYVRELACSLPIRHDHDLLERFPIDVPADFDGELSASYAIPIVTFGSRAFQNHGLLPWAADAYVHGFSSNTLMHVRAGADDLLANRTLEIVAPDGDSVFTGWGGLAPARQELALDPKWQNTVIAIGRPAFVARAESDDGPLEVVQLGQHPDRTQLVLDVARRVRASYVQTTGALPPGGERFLITEPGLGGTHVEGAISLGHPSLESNGRPDDGTLHFLAHEMFHAWLPGVLKPDAELKDGGLEWFFEGFTDYFALWHLVNAGLVTPQQFADRVRSYAELLHGCPAFGRVSLADRRVNWRSGDNETVAYRSGMLLAFHLDARLREAGEPGLPQLFRDLVREYDSVYSLASIQHWVEAQGLEDFWTQHVVGKSLPNVEDALVEIGYREKVDGERRLILAEGGSFGAFFRFAH